MPTALIRQAQKDWCLAHALPVLRAESTEIASGTLDLLGLGCDGFVVQAHVEASCRRCRSWSGLVERTGQVPYGLEDVLCGVAVAE